MDYSFRYCHSDDRREEDELLSEAKNLKSVVKVLSLFGQALINSSDDRREEESEER